MKNIFTLAALLVASFIFAQTPVLMSYQAVVRNSANELVKNQSVGVRFSILKTSASGSSVYTETQTTSTNSNGLVSTEVGSGTVVSGSFSAIDWSTDKYYMKTEIDAAGGTSYTISGTQQLMSVPYALYAKTSGSSTPGPKGDKGDKGDTGVTGADGAKGDKGDTGATGLQGATGATGATGLKGDKGDTGAGFANGTAAGQVYLTASVSPYAPQNPATVTGDVTISSSAVTTIAANAVTSTKINDAAVITAKIANNAVTVGKISATGIAGSNTYLRGDGSWTTPSSGTTLPDQTGNSGKFLTTDGSSLSWGAATSSAGAKLELVAKKTATIQDLVVSTSATPDLVIYDNIVTIPTLGTYSTTTNTYTAGSSGLYLIQTRNSMVDNATVNNTVGAYNYLEVNGSAYGSMTNIYPTYVSNGSLRSVTNALIKSSTQYMFIVYLSANDTIKIKATSLNSSVTQKLNNDGGTQLMIVKL